MELKANPYPCKKTTKNQYQVFRNRKSERYCNLWQEHEWQSTYNDTFSCFECRKTIKAYIYPDHGELQKFFNLISQQTV